MHSFAFARKKVVAGPTASLTYSFGTKFSAATAQATNSFTANFGTAATGRRIYVGFGAQYIGQSVASSATVTIAGTTATQIAALGRGNTTLDSYSAVYAANISTGTSGTVVVTLSPAPTQPLQVFVISVYGHTSAITTPPVSSQGSLTGSNNLLLGASMTAVTGGMLFIAGATTESKDVSFSTNDANNTFTELQSETGFGHGAVIIPTVANAGGLDLNGSQSQGAGVFFSGMAVSMAP